MRSSLHRLQAIAIALVVTAFLVPVRVSTAPELKKLKGIAEVKSWFNAGAGHPRMILLFSPT